VTGPQQVEVRSHRLALQRLLAVVRPEFRGEVLEFAADDPIFGTGPCRIDGCERAARGNGLCQGHRQRWQKAGRPEMDTFVASTDPRWRRQQPNLACRVNGCGYGSARGGLCQLHAQRWFRAGRPDLARWLSDPPAVKAPTAGTACLVELCALWTQAGGPLCHAHHATWRANGRPADLDAFCRRFGGDQPTADQVVQLAGLPAQLRLELQYALQCRRDEHTTKVSATVVMQVVRFLTADGAASLLDRDEAEWPTMIGRPPPRDSNPRALLCYARRKVEDLSVGDGWESEYPHDVWQLRRLGHDGNTTLRFDLITQDWLRDLVKRWVRWRLSTNVVLETVRRGLRSLTRFAAFCDRSRISSLAEIDRAVLERYLADLHAELAGRQRHSDQIGQLHSFLQAIRFHRWDPSLPATALLFSSDYPKRDLRAPRALAEQVMTQVEHPANLDRFTNQAYRLVTLILIRCGLRVSDALRLPRDCIAHDADHAPYLRYYNHKMRREALVPIDEELRGLIGDRQAQLGTTPLLFPRPTKNPGQNAPTSSSTYRHALYQWLARCEITDQHGQPVHLTPHQWRHTLGTRLINRDVPQEVVRRILDHDSPQMTAHYARLHDTTIRRHWENSRKINIAGQTVSLDPTGQVADAAWAKQRLGRATQALPNGFCGLPVQKSCPHANACLTCPLFITTAEFLPQHREHRQQVLKIITAAEAHGQTRLAEMNQRVADNLDTIITTLQAEEPADAR
jgi:integrase/ferredoxin